MISIKSFEWQSSMDNYSTIEGMIRQSTAENTYELTLLMGREIVSGYGVIKRGDGVYIKTDREDIPVYAFKMDKELQRVLKDGFNIWNG